MKTFFSQADTHDRPYMSMDRPFPERLQVEVTTRCNMRCAMCVKTAPGSAIPETNLDLESFKRLGSALEHCKALVLNGIGEPLLHPDLPEMAAFARDLMPADGWIGFQTNALLITPALADELVVAGVDTFCVSLDSLDCAKGEGELHGQTDVARLERAFSLLREAGRKHGHSLKLGVEFVLMAYTMDQLADVVRWAGRQGGQFMIVSHVLAYDGEMEAQSLFNPNTPEATALFDKWQARAKEEGCDLHDSPGVGWKFIKTPAQKRLSDLLREMQEEARSRDVWVHLNNLLDWDRRKDDPMNRRVAEVCREAESVAVECGLELRMPPLMARDERRCHFVEDGVAFVTSEGDVSPCQFLWHKYSCRMDGEPKNIEPWLFGNIAEKDLLDIWSGQEYSAFRSQVLAYEYPYCSNCPFVPCDDIRGAPYPFDYDCYGVTIPCGHCLWCMGGLQCLL